MRRVLAAAVSMVASLATGVATALEAGSSPGVATYRVVGDAIPESLASNRGDADRGRALVVARDAANCVLCHAFPEPSMRFAGDVGPSLEGVGRRLSVGQLRLRVVDNLRVNPASAMPSYHRVDGMLNVASRYAGAPILTAAEVEDVVAYLATLQ